MNSVARSVVLASTSRYRAELLARIVPKFQTCAPQIDESPTQGELPAATAARLAREKGLAVASRFPNCLVIGSDQVAELDGQTLGKAGNLDRARSQLLACSGRVVAFHTALCLIDTGSSAAQSTVAIDTTRVVFRNLTEAEVSRYLAIDEPFDCAGSFKIERAGVSLFERVESTDPTALIGLPLIALCRLLRAYGMTLP